MSQRADLGPPDLVVAGLQLWVHGRQFADADDYYDGNWLRVTAHCGASGASIWVQGAILMATDVAGFGDQCAAMLRGDSESAARRISRLATPIAPRWWTRHQPPRCHQ